MRSMSTHGVSSVSFWFSCGFDKDDLVGEGMSLHVVIGYYFSSAALLFYLSPSNYLHPNERPQQSPSSHRCSVVCLSLLCWTLTWLDHFKTIDLHTEVWSNTDICQHSVILLVFRVPQCFTS